MKLTNIHFRISTNDDFINFEYFIKKKKKKWFVTLRLQWSTVFVYIYEIWEAYITVLSTTLFVISSAINFLK